VRVHTRGATRIGTILCGGRQGPNNFTPGILNNGQQDQLLGQLAAEVVKSGQGKLPSQAGKMLAVALNTAACMYRPGLKDSGFFHALTQIIEALCGELATHPAGR
jgi:hypothetical protein